MLQQVGAGMSAEHIRCLYRPQLHVTKYIQSNWPINPTYHVAYLAFRCASDVSESYQRALVVVLEGTGWVPCSCLPSDCSPCLHYFDICLLLM